MSGASDSGRSAAAGRRPGPGLSLHRPPRPEADGPAWTSEAFLQQLQAHGAAYHSHHPFQRLMSLGRLDRDQIRGWVANRFYYQISIPLKDAAILANCPDREVRRRWLRRIIDHDGASGADGGIERWLRLGEACGLERQRLIALELVLPGVRLAVDAYVQFARSAPWQEAVAASLTELFAGDLHRSRLATWPRDYPWIDADGLAYFRQRVDEAGRDAHEGLALTLAHFTTRAQQLRVLDILRFKLDVLWCMLDALWLAYIGYGERCPEPEEGA